MRVTIGSKCFEAELLESRTSTAFQALSPLTLRMEELNGNEKYCYLPADLPSADRSVQRVEEGDLMLFSSRCIVLFYKSFPTRYCYTPIGRISNREGLQAALGDGDVEIRFEQE